jgi:hypothetical protein
MIADAYAAAAELRHFEIVRLALHNTYVYIASILCACLHLSLLLLVLLLLERLSLLLCYCMQTMLQHRYAFRVAGAALRTAAALVVLL